MTTTPLREGQPSSNAAFVAVPAPVRVARTPARIWRWFGLAFVFALVLELTCRIEDWVAFRAPLMSRSISINDLMMRDADGMHGRPNSRYLKWVMNEVGTRGPSVPVTPAPGTLRIVAVGASETFGLRESPGREYPRQLEDSLTARVARGVCGEERPSKVEVLNAGLAGMGLPTIEQDVRNRLRRLAPAIIVIYPTPVQYLQEYVPFAARPDSQSREVPPAFVRSLQPRAVERFSDQLKQVLPAWAKARVRASQTRALLREHPAGWQFTSVPQDRLAQYETDLRRVVSAIRQIGAIPVLVTHGNMFMGRPNPNRDALVSWEKFYPRATGATIVAFDSVARLQTLRVGADSAVATIDAATRLSTAPVTAFSDFVHFTDLGAAYMADAVGTGVLTAARASGRCGLATQGSNESNAVRH